MPEIELISEIALLLLYLVLIIAVIYFIISLRKFTDTADKFNQAVINVQKNIEDLKIKIEPVIENLVVIQNDIREISGGVKKQVDKVDGIVSSIKDTTDSVINLEQRIQKELETNIFDIINLINSFSKGVKTFFHVFKGKRRGNGSNLISDEEDYS